jgi:diguanylate cyclase (GGDEF)-like protein/PAS domain S-box-containing protein
MDSFKSFMRHISATPVTSLFTTLPTLVDAARMMFELSGNAAIVTDTGGKVVYTNQGAERFTGIRSHEVAGRPIASIVRLTNPKTGEAMEIPVQKVLVEARAMFLPDYTSLNLPGDQKVPVDGSLGPVFASDGRVLGTVLLLHDVSRYRLLTDALSLQANQDPLTGLINRREFETRVSRAIKVARTPKSNHALAYLDLDRFKIVNDVCGHAAGDELLRRIAAVLRSKVRERDTLARLGGDEFGLLLENCTLEAALQVCENLLDAVKEIQFTWQEKTFTVGVSIGLAVINDRSGELASLIAVTDAACYRAKENGRNRIEIHNPTVAREARAANESPAIARIVSALDENRFALFAQPIVAAAAVTDGREFFEVLAKMIGPDGAYIAPSEFLPAAERYQLMPALDRWIVRRAFETYSTTYSREAGGKQPTWSINIAATSLASEGFPEYITEQARLHEIRPESICFEITEAAAMAKNDNASEFIWGLKIDGFRFCIDDFGKSLGSLGSLKNLPIDFLKIDGSFIRDMLTDDVSMGMVEAIHRIGQMIGVRTIAECVETPAQFDQLKEMGVDFAQGYACGRPAPIGNLGLHPVPLLPDNDFPPRAAAN